MIGLRVRKHNCKNKNSAHGGFFATLADIAVGKTQCWSEPPPIPLVTTSLTIDYLGAARLGDWIEAAVKTVEASDRSNANAIFDALVDL